jgi:hypothetical protein
VCALEGHDQPVEGRAGCRRREPEAQQPRRGTGGRASLGQHRGQLLVGRCEAVAQLHAERGQCDASAGARLLGRSGLRVSPLALGTMTFGSDWGWGADRDETRKIFDAYVERGGNFIDTANAYTNGTAEQMVGEFARSRREPSGDRHQVHDGDPPG